MMQAGISKRSDGGFWIALSGTSLFLILSMMAVLAALILVNSFRALWPARIERVVLSDGTAFLGIQVNADVSPDGRPRIQYKLGNRELHSGADFRWVYAGDIRKRDRPAGAVLVTRMENGDFLGFIAGGGNGSGEDAGNLGKRLGDYETRWKRYAEPMRRSLADLGDEWQRTHFSALKARYELDRAAGAASRKLWRDRLARAQEREKNIKGESEKLLAEFTRVKNGFAAETAAFATAEGGEVTLPLSSVVDIAWPNAMSARERVMRFLQNVWNLLSSNPREANTEGGIYPALFGTVLLVFLMAISAFPLGVAAGVYLREYARDGILSRTARVAVNNLAGVPSIVYGIFGLGFFVYGMGGGIDALFYPERVAAGISTFGGGGILWSSLTLGLLTLPVVIVATEEALATVPSEVRQGSLALGATRFQTLWRVILPMASPGILTGFILAMARAAGEVAPLMLTGAVKSAPSLPLDGVWPFLHLERKFMHLGFHIYDMGFQSPNVESAKPLVYLTALVLLVLVFILNLAAFALRKRMRDKYAMKGF